MATGGKAYAVIAAVGNYTQMNIVNLNSFRVDEALMIQGLTKGLKFEEENLRILGVDGRVNGTELARTLVDFGKMLTGEDTFLFYFSGHGVQNQLLFSDMAMDLGSLLTTLDRMPAKNKVIILDCCYAGGFELGGPKQMGLEEKIASFAGTGIAVMASSSKDELSRLGPENNHSIYTGMVATMMMSEQVIRKGQISLAVLNQEVMRCMRNWNQHNPQQSQQPIYRASMGGTIYFQVRDYQPYKTLEIQYETKDYILQSVKPLSSLDTKRLCAFVIPKGDGKLGELPKLTRDIAKHICRAPVYSGKMSARKFGLKKASAIWCYFGHDERDLIRSNHYAYTIWTADQQSKEKYYKPNKNATIQDEIYIWENKSYEVVRRIQSEDTSEEQYRQQTKALLNAIINNAEEFIRYLQEVDNQIYTLESLKQSFDSWAREVRKQYFRLTDQLMPPESLQEWADLVLELAGWIVDLTILLEQEKLGEREHWLIHHSVRGYYDTLEKLKTIQVSM